MQKQTVILYKLAVLFFFIYNNLKLCWIFQKQFGFRNGYLELEYLAGFYHPIIWERFSFDLCVKLCAWNIKLRGYFVLWHALHVFRSFAVPILLPSIYVPSWTNQPNLWLFWWLTTVLFSGPSWHIVTRHSISMANEEGIVKNGAS